MPFHYQKLIFISIFGISTYPVFSLEFPVDAYSQLTRERWKMEETFTSASKNQQKEISGRLREVNKKIIKLICQKILSSESSIEKHCIGKFTIPKKHKLQLLHRFHDSYEFGFLGFVGNVNFYAYNSEAEKIKFTNSNEISIRIEKANLASLFSGEFELIFDYSTLTDELDSAKLRFLSLETDGLSFFSQIPESKMLEMAQCFRKAKEQEYDNKRPILAKEWFECGNRLFDEIRSLGYVKLPNGMKLHAFGRNRDNDHIWMTVAMPQVEENFLAFHTKVDAQLTDEEIEVNKPFLMEDINVGLYSQESTQYRINIAISFLEDYVEAGD